MPISRRRMIQCMAAAIPTALLPRLPQGGVGQSGAISGGRFTGSWESLKQYQAPEWFRDAKFGIWAHWTAQCVPEQGDWYARRMYLQGDPAYTFHVRDYGHPSDVGFMEINHLWKADAWDPASLMDLYVKAGAKYFVALANHHDNFDCFDSTHHGWNSVRIGPKKDIVGTWAALARARGLRFGVTNHSAHAWHWFQVAYGYDPEGPRAGVRYDAYRLKQADGRGTWWDGLDPQDLYTGPSMVMPEGITTIADANAWHSTHDRIWTEQPPAGNAPFVQRWYKRCEELVDKYDPDLLYFDDTELPLGQAGLDIAAHYYNGNVSRRGRLDAVLTSKGLQADHLGTMVLDIERGRADRILAEPWQTDTCIGDWHYRRSLFEQHRYKTADTVIRMLIDIVSKNGNLLLNIPLRGEGTIDDDERAVLAGLADWMGRHGEAIHGTRPFAVFGEGPPDVKGSANFNENSARPYTSEDIRFTTRGNAVYACALAWPADGRVGIRTLARDSPQYPKGIERVEVLGDGAPLSFTRDHSGLFVTLPAAARRGPVAVLKIL
jgi:alpha-L-fucosidase